MAVKDILFETDIKITDGDLDVGDSDAQHIEHILKTRPGEFYQFPTLGVGVDDNLHGNINKSTLKQTIRKNLELDNYRVNKIEVAGGIDELITSIDATRKR